MFIYIYVNTSIYKSKYWHQKILAPVCYRQGSSNCCSPEAQKHQCFHPLVLPRDVRKKPVSAKSWKKWKDGYKNENNKVVIVSFFIQALSQVKGESMNYFVPDYDIFASWTPQVILRWYGYPTNISQRAPNCYTWFFAGSQTKKTKEPSRQTHLDWTTKSRVLGHSCAPSLSIPFHTSLLHNKARKTAVDPIHDQPTSSSIPCPLSTPRSAVRPLQIWL